MFFATYDKSVTNLEGKRIQDIKKAPAIIVGAVISNFIEIYQRFCDILI